MEMYFKKPKSTPKNQKRRANRSYWGNEIK